MKHSVTMKTTDELMEIHNESLKKLEKLENAIPVLMSGNNEEIEKFISTISGVLSYIDQNIDNHITEEEEIIYPRVGSKPGIQGIVREMLIEHQEMRKLNSRMMQSKKKLLNEHPHYTPRTVQELSSSIERFVNIFREHLDKEKKYIIPAAEDLST